MQNSQRFARIRIPNNQICVPGMKMVNEFKKDAKEVFGTCLMTKYDMVHVLMTFICMLMLQKVKMHEKVKYLWRLTLNNRSLNMIIDDNSARRYENEKKCVKKPMQSESNPRP